MQTVTVVMEHSRVNLHSGTALLNIATEESLSAGAGVGEHCHLQPGRQQKQGHKSQIKEMAVGLQTARALVLYPAQLGNLPPWRGDGLLFMLSFSLQTWHFPSCAWRDYLRFISIEMNLFYFNRNELVLVKEGQCTACLFSAALGQPIFNTEKSRVAFAHC